MNRIAFEGLQRFTSCLLPSRKRVPDSGERLVDREGWHLSRTAYFWASCDRDRVGRFITMFPTQSEGLHEAIHFGVPSHCLLQ